VILSDQQKFKGMRKDKMRIAIFAETFLPKWDGIANTLCYLLEHLARRGHTALMFAPEGAPDRYANTPIIGLPSISFPFYRDLKFVPPIVNVADELAAFRPDVVHLVNLASLGLVGIHHAHNLNVPVVASYHTDMPGYARFYGMGLLEDPLWAYFRWLHNQADLNLCPSYYTKRQLEAHDFERVDVWGRGVDTQRYSPRHRTQAWRERLTQGEPERTLLIYVGRLATEKRIEWLRPLLDLLPDTALALVGEGPLREELEELFEGTRTVFTGYLSGQDLAEAYAAGDLFVFPSASETFGNVVLEAMASGLPVIAAGAGGPVDHVHNEQNGYLSDPEDADDFRSLVQQALADRTRLAKMSAGAQAYAETQTWDMILDGLLRQYAQVIRDHAGEPHDHTQTPQSRRRERHNNGGLAHLFRFR
jgi:phosphatidylinositol alpha 1,6-mannosyltransferase